MQNMREGTPFPRSALFLRFILGQVPISNKSTKGQWIKVTVSWNLK